MKTISSQSGAVDMPAKRPNTLQDYEPPGYSRRDTLLTMLGVLMVMLLASLDQGVVGTSSTK